MASAPSCLQVKRWDFGDKSWLLRHLYSHLAAHYAFRGQRTEAEEALKGGQLIVEQLASPEPLALLQMTQGLIASF